MIIARHRGSMTIAAILKILPSIAAYQRGSTLSLDCC